MTSGVISGVDLAGTFRPVARWQIDFGGQYVKGEDDDDRAHGDGDPGDEPREAETFFLRHAMTPVPFAEKADYFIKPRVVTPADLSGIRFDDYEVVVVANVSEITIAQALYTRRAVVEGEEQVKAGLSA